MDLTSQEKLKLINFFEFLLNKEIDKPLGEMDSQAVNNYIKILLHLQDKHIEHTPEYIEEQVRKIFHPEESITAPETVKSKQKRYKKTKVWLVAACIAILVALLSVVSVANDWNIFDFLTEKFGSVISAPIQEEQKFNGVSVIFQGKNTIYKSIEDALKSEKIEVLYPSALPDNISVNEIMIYKENNTDKLVYMFSDPSLFAEIEIDTPLDQSIKDTANETLSDNSITYYIFHMPDISSYQIEFEYNGNSYCFNHTDKDFLIAIVENLKEINYEN